VARAAASLERHGAIVERAKPKIDGADLMDAYMTLLTTALATGFPQSLLDHMESTRDADRLTLASGKGDVRGASYRLAVTSRYYEVARKMVVRQAQKDALSAFYDKGWDAILMPISTVPPFAHDHSEPIVSRSLDVDGVDHPYFSMLNWIALATSLHAPALAVPAGRTKGGLPVGVQLVGHWNGEDRLFDFAAALEDDFAFSPPDL